jgi:hypothetical protein
VARGCQPTPPLPGPRRSPHLPLAPYPCPHPHPLQNNARFFNADPAEYQVVFTRSATEALKIVGETYPWGPASEFAYLRENHNSVLGIREYAMARGGR